MKNRNKFLLCCISFMLMMTSIGTNSLNVFAYEEPRTAQLALNYNPNVNREEVQQLLSQIDLQYEVGNTFAIMPRSSYGAAWPYKSVTSNQVNCYGYVANLSIFINPGDLAYYNGALKTGDSVETVASYVLADMGRKYRVDSRILNSATDAIASNEYRIALRVGWQMVGQDLVYDYHFLLQCSDGTWCDKRGVLPSRRLGNINPSTYSWDLFYSDGTVAKSNFYNSTTKYIAVKIS